MAGEGGRFSGKVALVTGGASGMGLAVANRLASEGAAVAIADRDAQAMEAALAGLPAGSVAVPMDVTDEGSVADAVGRVKAELGGLDVAVNAAGLGLRAPLLDLELDDWRRVQDVNLAGVFLCCREQARAMRGRGGVIVNFASTNAQQPAEGLAAYCAAKAGVAMFTRVAAMELAAHRIRVVAVAPGLTETPMVRGIFANEALLAEFVDNIPMGRPGSPDEIAGAVAFLASDDAGYITGEMLLVDGGANTRRYPGMPT